MRDGRLGRRNGIALAALVAVTATAVAAVAVVQDRRGVSTTAGDSGPIILSLDGVVTRPDGSRVDTGVYVGVGGFGVLADGRVVVETGADGREPVAIRVYAADGTVEQTHPSGPERPLVSRSSVAWAGADGRLRVLRTGERRPVVLAASPKSERDMVLGIYGYDLVSVDCDGAAAECSVLTYYDSHSTTLPPGIRRSVSVRVGADGWEVARRGIPFPRPDVESPDGTTRLVAQPDYCVALQEVATGDEIGRTCDFSSLSYSPDGAHLAAIADGEIHVFDRDLRSLRTIPLPDDADQVAEVWADDDSLLLELMGEEEVVPDPNPGGDRPGGRYDWYLLDVPIDGSEPTVREGPVEGYHWDTNQWPWFLRDG